MKKFDIGFPDLDGLNIGVVGLGYVGLPLAVALTKAYNVFAYDKNPKRIQQLQDKFDITLEVSKKELENCERLIFTGDIDKLKNCRCFIVAVPTPIDKNNLPDLSPLVSATETVGSIIKCGDVVIYESTVFPGCTEEECVPILERVSNLKFNNDFFCGYSPERINPGDKSKKIYDIVKITAGSTERCAVFVDSLYKNIITAGTFKAADIRTAEAAKVIENTQRDLNIAFINELSIICEKLGLNTNNVLEAASTKWNFIQFRPGLVGGHCIGVDPYYLTFKSQELGHVPSTILAGRAVNDGMAKFIGDKVIRELNARGLSGAGSQILILGLTFKENCPDTRNSKVFDLIDNFLANGCSVSVWDPFITSWDLGVDHEYSIISEPKVREYDVILCAVAHDIFTTLPKSQIVSWKRTDCSFIYDVKSCLPSDVVDFQL
ncbi:nucleotide sugar dehydrogenase [Alphaproteobacteria bacterium]|nr:nucleotide sugar dehydrogenase [Alphaproteobacteria bacterium]